MKISYIGHACFMLTANDGTRVVTDPYDASVGMAMLPLEAELITMSHEHHDHNCEEMIVGAPRIVRGTEPAQAGGVKTYALAPGTTRRRAQSAGTTRSACLKWTG